MANGARPARSPFVSLLCVKNAEQLGSWDILSQHVIGFQTNDIPPESIFEKGKSGLILWRGPDVVKSLARAATNV